LLLGLDVAGTRAGTSALGGALRTVLYQLGKAVTYAALGAVAGLVGAGLEEFSSRAGGVLAIVFGVAALAQLAGLSALWPKKRRLLAIGAPPATTDRLLGLVRPLLVSSHPLRPFALGLALAFLPCMIALWALGLALLAFVIWLVHRHFAARQR
jgi:sulfite exporter TauE/SafE